MRDDTSSETSPFGPARPVFELTTLRVTSRLIDVSLEIQHGILNVWFGANGSGKSLLLRAVRAVLLGDYSEFCNDDTLEFVATFAIPQDVAVWTMIRDNVDRESFFGDFDDLDEEDENASAKQLDKHLQEFDNSILNPSPGVARPQIRLETLSGSTREYWFLVSGKIYEASSEVLELDTAFRAELRAMFPEPVSIDDNFVSALPIWLPKVLTWTNEAFIFPSSLSFARAQETSVTASEFFETTPRNSEASHTEVEWNVRVKEQIHAFITRLIEISQKFLPAFVSESWTLTYQFSPLTFGNQRIQIKLRSRTSDSNDVIDLTNASEGIKRWVAISLAIASIVLWATLEKEFLEDLWASFGEPKLFEVPHYYFLIDEPEAHLSLNAIKSIADPISHLAPMTTLIATHSPILIDNLRGDATFRGIRGTNRTREVHTFPLTDFVYLRGFEEEMGLRASELLLRNGRLLLVEGDHDEIVLKHWYGTELDDHGVYIVKTSGTKHLDAILKLPLLKDVSKRVAVLLDKSDHKLPQYLEGVEVRVFTLSQIDILYYVPVGAVRVVAAEFPTWNDTWLEYTSNGTWRNYRSPRDFKKPTSHGWKKYIDKTYNLNLSFSIQRKDGAKWKNGLNEILETTLFQPPSLSQEEMEHRKELAQKVRMIIDWFEEPPSMNK